MKWDFRVVARSPDRATPRRPVCRGGQETFGRYGGTVGRPCHNSLLLHPSTFIPHSSSFS